MSRGNYEDATRKLIPWNSSLARPGAEVYMVRNVRKAHHPYNIVILNSRQRDQHFKGEAKGPKFLPRDFSRFAVRTTTVLFVFIYTLSI